MTDKTTSIIGGSSFISVLIGMVRTKVLAVLLGPAGVGLVGLYTGHLSTAATVVGMGVGTVGTRQVAEATAQHDDYLLAVGTPVHVLGNNITGFCYRADSLDIA